jgi:hypothetical protein
MRTKSAYREKPAENIPPAVEAAIAPAAEAPQVTHNKTTDGIEIDFAPEPKPDEAALALQRQIEELRKSEELNRQRQEQQTRQQAEQQNYAQQLQQVFLYWKNSGLSESEERLLLTNPAIIPAADAIRWPASCRAGSPDW